MTLVLLINIFAQTVWVVLNLVECELTVGEFSRGLSFDYSKGSSLHNQARRRDVSFSFRYLYFTIHIRLVKFTSYMYSEGYGWPSLGRVVEAQMHMSSLFQWNIGFCITFLENFIFRSLWYRLVVFYSNSHSYLLLSKRSSWFIYLFLFFWVD